MDWDGLRELIAADARLLVADRFLGPLADAPYFNRYERLATPWQMVVGEVEGQPVVISLRKGNDGWTFHSIVRVDVAKGLITRVVDYMYCPWVQSASSVIFERP